MTAEAGMSILAAAVMPGLFWLWLFRSRDWRHPEPWRLVWRTFFVGAALAVPTALVGAAVPETMLRTLLVAPLIEELAKLLAVLVAVWREPAFDEPVDGLVYAAAAALGFATVETVGYSLVAALLPGMVADPRLSPETAALGMAALRGLLTGPGHAIWTCAWGYPLARLRIGGGRGWVLRLAAGFAVAVGAHALFNLLSLLPGAAARGAMVLTVVGGLGVVLVCARRLTR